jgi:uncharacterized protein YeaO (DUF488 family)
MGAAGKMISEPTGIKSGTHFGESHLARGRRQAMSTEHRVQVRRAYDEPRRGDGIRVLVDRLWPRGLTKEKAHLDEWCKAVSPSTELRKWYGHAPEHFEEFGRRYRAELKEPMRAEAVEHLRELAKRRNITLLTATKNVEISEATVIANLIQL